MTLVLTHENSGFDPGEFLEQVLSLLQSVVSSAGDKCWRTFNR